MGRKKKFASPELQVRAQADLKGLKDARLHLKLLAVERACVLPTKDVAKVFDVAPDSVRRWVMGFAARGLEGLRDRPKGHNPSKLKEKHLKEIAGWLREQKDAEGAFVHWTIPLLQAAIERRWGVRISRTPLQGYVKRLKFHLKAPRPAHTKADPAAQAEFKNKRPKRSLNS